VSDLLELGLKSGASPALILLVAADAAAAAAIIGLLLLSFRCSSFH